MWRTLACLSRNPQVQTSAGSTAKAPGRRSPEAADGGWSGLCGRGQGLWLSADSELQDVTKETTNTRRQRKKEQIQELGDNYKGYNTMRIPRGKENAKQQRLIIPSN